MIENLSFILPLFIPIYYQLPLEYYIGFFLFTVSNFYVKENLGSIHKKMFQYECFIFMYSLYIFHSIIPSYIITAVSLFNYEWTEGIFFRTSLFLLSFIMNYHKNPFLFYPFIYLILILPSYIIGNTSIFKKSEIIQYNIIQTVFFFLCYQPVSSHKEYIPS